MSTSATKDDLRVLVNDMMFFGVARWVVVQIGSVHVNSAIRASKPSPAQ